MAKVTYTPIDGAEDGDVVTVFGRPFVAGEAIEVTDERQLQKLSGNPSFKVAGQKAEAADRAAAEDDRRMAKVVDGRTKEARDARAKADLSAAEAAAAERARDTARAAAAARDPNAPEG
jgi:hypothetical protein